MGELVITSVNADGAAARGGVQVSKMNPRRPAPGAARVARPGQARPGPRCPCCRGKEVRGLAVGLDLLAAHQPFSRAGREF